METERQNSLSLHDLLRKTKRLHVSEHGCLARAKRSKMFLRPVLSSHSSKLTCQFSNGSLLVIRQLALLSVLLFAAGCNSSRPTQVEETDEYSFDDITSQLAAEEAASAAQREE